MKGRNQVSKSAYFVDEEDVETMGFDWGRFTVTCSPEVNGAVGFSAGFVTMGPRQGHTRHNHPGAEEIIVVLSGSGEQMVEDDAGKPIVRTVGPGCTIYVPADRFHYTVNTGDVPMKVFVVYSPPGSELALRALPDFKRIAPGR
jgi:oxalate decarboxylase/phosphoglucose isomerase-like protein (cupin superfamily)